jgi:hypothetical protein
MPKTRVIFGCFLYFAFIPALSFAAPTYGPQMPSQQHFFAGLQTYDVMKRTLEGDYGKMHSLQDFFLISYGVFDWLSLDLKGGLGNVRQRAAGPDINYPTFLGGGYGFRLRLYDHERTKIVFGFQHISVHPYTVSIGGSKNKVVLDDWQFPLLVSHEFFNLRPYIGARWSWMNQIHWTNDVRKLEKSQPGKSVGLIAGTDIPLNKRVWFNIEGQFYDATAVTGSVNFSF